MNIFFGFNFPLREYFFCTSPAPAPNKFSNGPSLIHFYELDTLKYVYQISRQTVAYVPRADLGVGPGGPAPPFVREILFFWYFELCCLNIFSLINIVSKKRICVRNLHF